MAHEVILPKWGLTMEEGTISVWHKRTGDAVAEGEVIAIIETDKIETELPSPAAGTITAILVDEQSTVPVGTVIAIIE
ncbi:MAG TPA: biotin/lipoyl-containing protein [Acidimicrobiia bacterium]|nr:biotin/lipoyl-containing protein [Acidimicrobiia bacterium]